MKTATQNFCFITICHPVDISGKHMKNFIRSDFVIMHFCYRNMPAVMCHQNGLFQFVDSRFGIDQGYVRRGEIIISRHVFDHIMVKNNFFRHWIRYKIHYRFELFHDRAF